MLDNIFTAVNLLNITAVIVCGCRKADVKYWMIKKEDIPTTVRGGEGGFMPFGISGVMAGAAKCFFGFEGFDCVATTGLMAAIFNLEQLIDMMSIGTLLAYTIVAICVLMLRDPNPVMYERPMELANGMNARNPKRSLGNTLSQLLNLTMMKHPDPSTERISNWAITVMSTMRSLIPALSIFMNSYLMLKLDLHKWIRFEIWLFIGMLIYLTYSIQNSVEGIKDRISATERKPSLVGVSKSPKKNCSTF